MKDFAKSIVCNTKAGNSNKAEIIEKKKKEGATLKVDNGQKLEFSDGSTYVKTSFSDDYREAHNYTGNTRTGNTKVGNYKPDYKGVTDQELKNWIRMNEQDIREYTREAKKYEKFGSRPEFKGSYDALQYGHAIGEIEDRKEKIKWMQDELAKRKRIGNTRTGNSYNWEERRGHQELYDPTVPFGGHVRGYVEKTKNGYVGAKTNGSIVIKQKEFATEAEAKKFVENKQAGNSKVGNANTHLTASNSGELWLNFDGTGEMYDPIELGRYDFSGKSEALSVARELEQLKRKAEQRVKDADKFINAIKQWAAGLK